MIRTPKGRRTQTSNITKREFVANEARCHCGQLMAKLTEAGVELKCKRCKRLVLLPFASLQSGMASILTGPCPSGS
ncbi:MAG: hypothetical protein D6690_03050 [Nitrospirae bacterium]|nr:MAG: hypothetical protein D6690_03050 [Nitrospirota bacterium]